MSAILSADDLNDFISPGVACVKPVETLPLQKPKGSNVCIFYASHVAFANLKNVGSLRSYNRRQTSAGKSPSCINLFDRLPGLLRMCHLCGGSSSVTSVALRSPERSGLTAVD